MTYLHKSCGLYSRTSLFFFTFKGKEIVQKSTISRLMVYEHELVGYFTSGDTVEIRGLLQQASKVPSFYETSLIDTHQIFLGGQETFGNEYIRLITEKNDIND